jgi:hypothetical protein
MAPPKTPPSKKNRNVETPPATPPPAFLDSHKTSGASAASDSAAPAWGSKHQAAVQSSPSKAGAPKPSATQFTIVNRLKGVAHDAVAFVGANPQDEAASDTFLLILEDAVKSLRAAKVDARNGLRRTKANASSASPLAAHADPEADKVRPVSASPEVKAAAAPAKSEPSKAESASKASTASTASKEAAADRKAAKEATLTASLAAKEAAKAKETAKETKEAPTESKHGDTSAPAKRSYAAALSIADAKQSEAAKPSKPAAAAQAATALPHNAKSDERAVPSTSAAADADEKAKPSKAAGKTRGGKKAEEKPAAAAEEKVVSPSKPAKKAQHDDDEKKVAPLTPEKKGGKGKAAAPEEHAEAGKKKEPKKEDDKKKGKSPVEAETPSLSKEETAVKAEEEATAAKKAKADERAAAKEEQRLLAKERAEKQQAKLKEAKERRQREEAAKGLIALRSDQQEEGTATLLVRFANVCHRHAKTYLEQQLAFATAADAAAGNVKPNRFRAALVRCTARTAGGTVITREPLKEVTQGIDAATSEDHDYLRASNSMLVLTDCAAECRKQATKQPDPLTLRLVLDVLHKLLLHPKEGPAHIDCFVRTGCTIPLAVVLREEIMGAKKVAANDALASVLSLLHLSMQHVLIDAPHRPQLQVHRTMLAEVIQSIDLVHVLCTACATLQGAEHLETVHVSALLLWCVLHVPPKTVISQRQLNAVVFGAMAACLAHVTRPYQAKPDEKMPAAATAVLLVAFRTMNHVARHNVEAMQQLVVDGHAEFHAVLCTVCDYVTAHHDQLEDLHSISTEQAKAQLTDCGLALSQTFVDAIEFGVTVQKLPRPDGAAKSSLRAALHEMLLLIGYACFNNAKVQDMFNEVAATAEGWSTPLLAKLLTCLPMVYFGIAKHIFVPTMLCVCHKHEKNEQILCNDMDAGVLRKLVRDEMDMMSSRHLQRMSAVNLPNSSKGSVAGDSVATGHTSTTMSWAEMSDSDDDSAFASMSNPDKNGDSGSKAIPTEAFTRFARSLTSSTKRPVQVYAAMFRLDRRFARECWHETQPAPPAPPVAAVKK